MAAGGRGLPEDSGEVELVPGNNGDRAEAAPRADDSEADQKVSGSAGGARGAGGDAFDVKGCAFASGPFRCIGEA